MATTLLTKLFGSRNDRLLKQYRKKAARINALEPELEKLSDEALRAKTEEFRERLAKGESIDDLLPEAFAVVREGSKRVMKMRHFDVQLVGAFSSKMMTMESETAPHSAPHNTASTRLKTATTAMILAIKKTTVPART